MRRKSMTIGKKPWSGRFQKPTAPNVEKFTSSIHYDRRLYPYDIEGSVAHKMKRQRLYLL